MERSALSMLFLIILYSGRVWASGITYHGRLLKPDGTPVLSSSVQFKLQIRTPGVQDCLMYEEIQTMDLSQTGGVFSLSLGDGSGVRQDSHSWSLFDAFSNRKDFNFSMGDCTGINTFSPDPGNNRKFRVFFNDGSFSGWEALPIQTINFIPMAIESYAVGGFPASSLFRVEDSGNLGNISPMSTTQYNSLVSLANGTSSVYEKSGELGGSTLPSLTSGQSFVSDGSGGWMASTPLTSESDPNVSAFAKTSLPTCASGEVLKSDGTNLTCVTDSGGWTAADATTTTKGIVSVPTAGGLEVSSGAIGLPDQTLTPGSFTKVTVNQKGIVTAGTTLSESDLPNITTAGKVSGDALTSGTIGGSTSMTTTGDVTADQVSARGLYLSNNQPKIISILPPASITEPGGYTLTLPEDNGTSGQVLSTNGSGVLSWISPATGSVTGITATSPISVGGTATAPVISLDDSGVGVGSYGSATQVPTITVDAKGRITDVTEATISGVSPVGSTLSTGKVWVGSSGVAQERFIGIADIRSTIGPTYAQFFPTNCDASETLKWDSPTDTFVCATIQAPWGSVTGKPTTLAGYGITDAGTITGVTAGTGLSGGGTTGNVVVNLENTAVTPGTYTRANLTVNQQGQITAASSGGDINLTSEVMGTLPVAQGGTGVTSLDSTFVLKNGQNGALTVGTNDAQSLELETSGSTRLTINSGGNVGVGGAPSSYKVDVSGTLNATELRIGGTVVTNGIQGSVTTVAVLGNSCSTVGQLAKDASGNLMVCDDTPSVLTTTDCSTLGVGAVTFNDKGEIYVCAN